MTITNSLYIGISGLTAHGEAISVVGDNIANTSTIGFKRERASFSDVLGGELGGFLGSQRLGGGVRLGSTQTMWDQGTITQTGNPLDVAISGHGLFVLRGDHGGRAGEFYSRDGRLQLDNQGFLVDQRGLHVQGFPIDARGNIQTIGDLPLGARQSPPAATSRASLTLNLDANATVPPAFDPASPATTSSFATSSTVIDSLGGTHHVEVYFRAQGNGSWEWHAMVDGGELTGGTPGTLTQIGTGALTFDTSGRLLTQTGTATASFAGATPNQVINLNFGDDVASGGTGLEGTTQYSGASAVTAIDVDGRRSGNLTDLSIGDDGTIRGVFDNGDRLELARLALADFANLDGLERVGQGLLLSNAASGAPGIDVPGTGARGSMVAGALEASNVDRGTELVTLIAFQRAFQANSKTVTTADEMLSDITNLKR